MCFTFQVRPRQTSWLQIIFMRDLVLVTTCKVTLILFLLCISTSERMLAHVFAWSKTMKNIGKWWKKYFFHHAHERLMWDARSYYQDYANSLTNTMVKIHNIFTPVFFRGWWIFLYKFLHFTQYLLSKIQDRFRSLIWTVRVQHSIPHNNVYTPCSEL